MPGWMEWVFDGIGSNIISLIVGALAGGVTGYKIGIHKKVKQEQIAGSKAKQRQEFVLENEDVAKEGGKIKNSLQQSQNAGDNAEQVQVGGIKHGH